MDRRVLGVVVVSAMVAGSAVAQPNRIDVVTPSAPELAAFGSHAIGVRTLQVTDRNRPDVSSTKPGGPTVRYDRTLTIEVWYPAAFPLVIVSHGYPGNRYLMSHLGENLASKGFVVASIDHADSTYDDQKHFASTLYNRPFDQLFVLTEMDRLGRRGSGSFLSGLVDASRGGPGRLLDGRLRCRQRHRGRIQPSQRDAVGRAAEPAARRPRHVESRVPEEPRLAHQGGDRDRSLGNAGRLLGCRRPEGHPDAGVVRGRKHG